MIAKKKARRNVPKKAGAKRAARPANSPAPSVSAVVEAGAKREPHQHFPLHLQDKWGYCGAACMMMLIEDAFPAKPLKSQGELMRAVKKVRDERPSAWSKESESHYGWHASPRELEAVLNEEFIRLAGRPAKKYWSLERCYTSKEALEKFSISKGAAIALVWHPALMTPHPHWVVIEREDNQKGFRVLDPAVTGLPERIKRFETFEHGTKRFSGKEEEEGEEVEGVETGQGLKSPDLHICPCRIWRGDDGHELHTAEKIWVHREKLLEMLDDGATRAGGPRCVIVRVIKPDTDASERAEKKAADRYEFDKPLSELVRDWDHFQEALAARLPVILGKGTGGQDGQPPSRGPAHKRSATKRK
jgi:hypothetical protein